MANWMQLFGVTLVLFSICISSSLTTGAARIQSMDHEEFRRVPESQGRRKTRRMMMGLGSEIGWVTPEFGAGPGYTHRKRARSLGSGTAASKPDSFRDSVIVLKNNKRSEVQPTTSVSAARSAGLKSNSFGDSVIVLRSHKRSEGEETMSQTDALQPKIVLKNAKRSPSSSSNSSFRDSTIVLKQHKRSASDKSKPSVSDSSIVLKGQQPGSTAASKSSIKDSAIVLKSRKRAEDQEIDLSRDETAQPKIVLKDHNESKAASVSTRSLHDSTRSPESASSGSPVSVVV